MFATSLDVGEKLIKEKYANINVKNINRSLDYGVILYEVFSNT